MKIYLAGPFDFRFDLRTVARRCETLGHEVTSSWIWEPQEHNDLSHAINAGTATFDQKSILRLLANRDKRDIKACDVFVRLTGGGPSRGGKHWETGYADALGKRIILVGGKRDTLFDYHYQLAANWDELYEALH